MAYDPQAQYNALVADIGLQEAWEEGKVGEEEAGLKAGTAAAESGITEAEPGTYRSSANAASRGGILHSGIQGRRTEDIRTRFAARRAANQRAQLEGQKRIERGRQGFKLEREKEQHGGQTTLAAEKDRIARENPPAAPFTLGPNQLPGGGYRGQSQGAAENPGQWIGNVRVGGVAATAKRRAQWKGNVRVG